MAALTLQEAGDGNQNITFASAAGGGDTAPAGFRASAWELSNILIARNTDATSKTVTVDGVGYVVPATTGVAVIPLRSGALGSAKAITYSGVTGVTVAAVRLTRVD